MARMDHMVTRMARWLTLCQDPSLPIRKCPIILILMSGSSLLRASLIDSLSQTRRRFRTGKKDIPSNSTSRRGISFAHAFTGAFGQCKRESKDVNFGKFTKRKAMIIITMMRFNFRY